MDLNIRSCAEGEAPALAQVFHRAVHEGAATRYTQDERMAWSPDVPAGASWEERLGGSETVVAEQAGRPVGFMSLDMSRGYLDLAFVAPEVMGRGVAALIYAVVEGRARSAGLTRLTAEASLLAEPFFRRQGWRVVKRQNVERLGVELSNTLMEKDIAAREAVA